MSFVFNNVKEKGFITPQEGDCDGESTLPRIPKLTKDSFVRPRALDVSVSVAENLKIIQEQDFGALDTDLSLKTKEKKMAKS